MSFFQDEESPFEPFSLLFSGITAFSRAVLLAAVYLILINKFTQGNDIYQQILEGKFRQIAPQTHLVIGKWEVIFHVKVPWNRPIQRTELLRCP